MTDEIIISPSQVKKYRDCPRKIGFHYIEDIKEPSSPKQKFGTEVHAQLERWLRDATPPDDTPVGRIALQGITRQHLPVPDPALLVEHEFRFDWAPGIVLRGFIDCLVPPGVEGRDRPLVIDHKTTADLRWAMPVEDLAVDSQALIYAVFAMLEYKTTRADCRWVYYAASNPRVGVRKPRGAVPVAVTLEVGDEQFEEALRQLDTDLQSIAEIRRRLFHGRDLPPNPAACQRYGGCFYQNRCQLNGPDALAAYLDRDAAMKK